MVLKSGGMWKILLKYALPGAACILAGAILKSLYGAGWLGWDQALTLVAGLFLVCGLLLAVYLRPAVIMPESSSPTPVMGPETLLSRREQEVFACLRRQMTHKEICASLCIESSTLKTHINRIYKKLEVNDRREFLLRYGGVTA